MNILQQWGNAAVCLFILIYTIATVLGIPGTILTIAGGAVFGLIWGTLWSVVGATLGAVGAFWAARYLLRDWAKRQFGDHKALVSFNQAVTDKPVAFVLAVRFAPISPFNIVNFLFGLTPIEAYHYTIGTFFGIIPGTIAYTWLGVTGDAAWRGGDSLPFFIALCFLGLLSLLPILVRNKR
ncbi:MAG TPA: TVP38/TMEM64 family protein [Cyanobacteria bacterium UBA11149]|nr:TVP38/TMEM64 family protein [Cyanobacteria bacterium UBA11367]HBE58793.1 TVP38/TMEM64 family protein [Cyanobacteria bacterium UBA11366]HBR77141.1 TVP38/TMEM64 family protein [Cyanobacteria bacterium UBA11159]HBS67629.1 TVP38/TMEM64 family protein [Cyanobacteria bacterium UBA11153]HBW87641.1 TVP38/TMEM64 family protein [Cyanobacteria bacterium UBA11149]HCA96697.1 TVP38/TMEM64 family protein [Cyanobacteria bacterium UBA9226]